MLFGNGALASVTTAEYMSRSTRTHLRGRGAGGGSLKAGAIDGRSEMMLTAAAHSTPRAERRERGRLRCYLLSESQAEKRLQNGGRPKIGICSQASISSSTSFAVGRRISILVSRRCLDGAGVVLLHPPSPASACHRQVYEGRVRNRRGRPKTQEDGDEEGKKLFAAKMSVVVCM